MAKWSFKVKGEGDVAAAKKACAAFVTPMDLKTATFRTGNSSESLLPKKVERPIRTPSIMNNRYLLL